MAIAVTIPPIDGVTVEFSYDIARDWNTLTMTKGEKAAEIVLIPDPAEGAINGICRQIISGLQFLSEP